MNVDDLLVPQACCAGLGTVPNPKGRKKRDTKVVVIQVSTIGGIEAGVAIRFDDDAAIGRVMALKITEW